MTAATPYVDETTTDWYTLALGKEEQPKDWEDFEETLLRHFSAQNLRQAKDHLTRVRQTGTVQDYLWDCKEALAECPGLPKDEKKEIFIDELRLSIALHRRTRTTHHDPEH